VKDRIGRRMVEDAEQQGRIKPGDTLIEPTSGNTGIGLALAAAIKGYRMIITLPEKMSQEKVNVLKGLGAEIIRTPTEAAWDSPESHIGVARRLNKEIPNSHILDQYTNPSNPNVHYDETGEEIIQQMGGHVDMVVVGAGTGGTITGIGRKIKERLPNCKVIGVDPVGSILAQPESLNGAISSYHVEGIGYDFIPDVLDRSVVDKWYKSVDKESFFMARRLIKEEGLLCGGSSGTAMYVALQACRDFNLGPNDRCVVLLPDSTRNYMTKFLTDDWMVDNNFLSVSAVTLPNDQPWASQTVADLKLQTPVTIAPSVSCKDAVDVLTKHGIDQLPVIDSSNNILGMVTEGQLVSMMSKGRVKPTDTVEKALFRQFKKVCLTTPLVELSRIFDRDHFALVVENNTVHGIATRIDLLKHITATTSS